MFVRFVIARRHRDTGVHTGIFEATLLLPRVNHLPYWDEARLNEILDWFNVRLPSPTRVARSRRPHGHHAAVSWFRSSARRHIARAWDLAAILDAHDLRAHMVTAYRPGYIVYEDAFQVLAEPFRSEHPRVNR